MKQHQFISALSKLNPTSTFLTLAGYRSENDEVADYNIIFHINYENALMRSLTILDNIRPNNELQTQAKSQLIESYTNSLDRIFTQQDANDIYETFTNAQGTPIKGIKKHIETETLHIYGLFNNKRVITQGNYKQTNKRPLTIEKDKMRRLCPVSKFRQFILAEDRVDHIRVANLELLPPTN